MAGLGLEELCAVLGVGELLGELAIPTLGEPIELVHQRDWSFELGDGLVSCFGEDALQHSGEDLALVGVNHGWPREVVELMVPRMTLGGPDDIGAAISELAALGIDGVTLNLAANAHDPEMIALAAEVAGAALG